MSSFGILAYGAHAPRSRIARSAIFEAVGWAQQSLKGLAKGERAFAAWDEDAVTMGVGAARIAMRDQAPVDSLCFASTTAPFLDRQNAGVVAAALDMPAAAHCFDVAGSQRAGLSALLTLSKAGTRALAVAADKRPTKPASVMEMLSGDAGAAVLVGTGEPIAEIVGAHSVHANFVDRYRTAASDVEYVLEERWNREAGIAHTAPAAVKPLFERCGVTPADIDCFIAPTANPALAAAAADAVGVARSALADNLFERCGHAGAAHPLLMLANALDSVEPGMRILVTAFGQGCDAMLLRATDALPGARPARSLASRLENGVNEENYTRFLAASGRLDVDYGMRAERDNRTAQTVAWDKSRDVYGFVGGFCTACSTPQFPKSRRCVNPDCGALDTQEDYRFADRAARVKSFTEDWMAFTREPPLIYGNVSFEGGGNMFMEMTGFKPGEISIGAPLAMTFRIKDIDMQRGFHRYFWKAAPAGGADG